MISRYETPEMRAIWSNRRKLEIWQEIEVLVCEVRAERGEMPAEAARVIRAKAAFDEARVLEIEDTVHHDVIAFLTNLAENIGPESRFVHEGMTSSDLGDTAFAVQMKESGAVIRAALVRLLDVVRAKAQEHKRTPMVGRSHGIHAEPTTFGLKLLVYWAALNRGLKRLDAAIADVTVGQISGAVGTMVHLDPEIEAEAMRRLGLQAAPVATQVLQRDRHAAFLAALALLGATLEQMAVEIRNLQRTDVHEVEEPFAKGQKGSSAMPHKKNPIISERITGMARVLRGYAHTAMENVALWHERDISHSGAERIIFPDGCHLLHYMLGKMTWLIDGLVVFPERMLENMGRVRGMVFSQTVLLALVRAGVSREDSYAAVQRCAMRVWDEDVEFLDALRSDAFVADHLPAADLERCFDFAFHQRNIDHLFERTLATGA
ncbi:MAG TPA: adenylosuccinate lyase [Candidatus Krumholzibacteria bacterium]|nr:adenylosuccinate lyase [Candidatus Krumholzibacteria bacterium]HRX52353.1 adenylosuccinate lyase [Candidatus Krumholzibacteria bacterium]